MEKAQKEKTLNSLTWGLFNTNPFAHPIRFFKDIKTYFKRRRFLLKHGYPSPARWETYYWFIITMKEILEYYKNDRTGYPMVLEDYHIYEAGTKEYEEQEERLIKAWDSVLDKMSELLDQMDEESDKYVGIDYCNYNKDKADEQTEALESAKNEFFQLFSKYFWDFWD